MATVPGNLFKAQTHAWILLLALLLWHAVLALILSNMHVV